MIGRWVRGWPRAAWIALVSIALLAALLIWRAAAPPEQPAGRVMNVPPFNQGDYTQVVAVIGGQNKSVKSSGCGAACVAAVGQYMTGDERWDPQTLFEWAHENGYYSGDGLSHACLREMAALFGLRARWTDASDVRGSLRAMKPVIAHMKNGYFSSSTGHYIVLVGETEDGQVVVHDPGSRARSGKAYDWGFLVDQTKGSDPFMILS